MAVLALFLPVALLGALLGLARVEEWTTPRRPSAPEPDGAADGEAVTVDLREKRDRPDVGPAVEPAVPEVSAPAA